LSVTAVLLVLLSAATHAYWNYLLKRAGGSHEFVAISKASEAVVYLPVFLVVAWRTPASSMEGLGLYIAVGTVFVLASYVTLAAAYKHGDLSFAYPIARGGALLFLPALGAIFLDEHVGPIGWWAIAAIIAGVVVMQLPRLTWEAARGFWSHASGPATFFAMLMALLLATGTIWDKRAVLAVPLFAYFYGYTAAAGVCYLGFILWRRGLAPVRAEWAAHKRSAVAVGVLNTISYGLALFALRDGGSTYVIGLRQVSIAVGVALGASLLREHVSVARRVGVGLVLTGCFLMAWGR
jgi:multidrug transporter EmrE-like cation transporter